MIYRVLVYCAPEVKNCDQGKLGVHQKLKQRSKVKVFLMYGFIFGTCNFLSYATNDSNEKSIYNSCNINI